MRNLEARIQSVEDARYFAKRRVPKSLFQLFEAGSGAGVTARLNEKAFEDVLFRPRAAVSHPQRELGTTVLGHEISMPVIVSSVGALNVGHRDGEVGVARAAGAAGTIQFVSGATTSPIEAIVASATGPVFFQLYFVGGREASAPIIERAKRAGVDALVVIADSAAEVHRERPYPERVPIPAGVTLRDAIRFAPQLVTKPAWLLDFVRGGSRNPWRRWRCARTARRCRGTSRSRGSSTRHRRSRTSRGSARAGTARSS